MLNLTKLTLFCLFLCPAGDASVWADEVQTNSGGLKVGLSRADITPDKPVWLYGYAARDHRSENVYAPIFVKALAIEDGRGQRAVLVTTDLGAVYTSFCDGVYALVKDKLNIPREHFLFTAAHNHSAPIIAGGGPAEDPAMDESRAREIAAYTDTVQQKLAKAILDAVADLQPAELSWGIGFAPFVMNRREFTAQGVQIGINPRGPVDRSVPVLKIARPNGALRGIVFGTACHNTTLGAKSYQICGEYAGFAQAYLEDHYPGTQAMFITGLAADANPYPRSGDRAMELAEQHGRTLGVEVARVLGQSQLSAVRGPLTIAYDVAQLPVVPAAKRPRSAQPQETADSSEPLPSTLEAPVAAWQFGDDLTLVALSGEVVVDYVSLIEQALGQRNLWLAAYSHNIFGYLTSARVQREGGYEARGIGRRMQFSEEAQDALLPVVEKVAKEAGREDPRRPVADR